MHKPDLARDSMAVVVLGGFEPIKITPRWLRQENLIGPEDYESFEVEIISSSATIVTFDTIQVKALPDTLQVGSDTSADAEAVRDLAVGILLSGGATEVAALGINRMVHFSADSGRNHIIGDSLAPKDMWSEVLPLAGLQNLNIRGARDDGYGGAVNVQVQPSVIIPSGVFVSVNDHYNLTRAPTPTDRDSVFDPEQNKPQRSPEKVAVARDILINDFGASRLRAQSIVEHVVTLGRRGGTTE
ncbi:hypothetical protein [Kitasatospora sp. DSM 101779]|uniref:hypothetical protein n=1 Tax=Kitasatospora sp. DSM 101779 TaxID=2853165 RepID=UPI0021DB1CE6|nr:hypothetical protein [Kitasatospora sp. DSM 101779]MCU7822188.1 hypothetical protein [Kitasatospora sp. DSM 101779]